MVGFPEEHEGEKWGMSVDVPCDKKDNWRFPSEWEERDNKEILVYNFTDTSPGQSGSPVMGMNPEDILGVHTGESVTRKKNWATYITPPKLEWIAAKFGKPLENY